MKCLKKRNSVFKIKMTYIVKNIFLHVPFFEFEPLPLKGSLHGPGVESGYARQTRTLSVYKRSVY